MRRLPLALRARPVEPGHGIMMRLGARNGYPSSHRFAGSLGLDVRKMLTGSHAAELAVMAGLDSDLVRHCSPAMVMPGRKISLCGQDLELGDWSTRDRRYCPACHALDLEEARRLDLRPEWYLSHRTTWDVRLISACPAHGIELNDHCHGCGKALGWQSTDLLRCAHCRADLLAVPCVPVADPVGGYVARRLTRHQGGNDVLDRLPLSGAIRLCERLGQIEAIGAVRTLPRQNQEMLLRARAEGFQMTLALKRRVLSALDTVIRRNQGPNGLHGAYGWIYGEWLTGPDPAHDQVRYLLFRHAVYHGVISGDEARLGNDAPITITMTQSARRLGMSYKRARMAATEAGIVPRGSRRSVAFTMNPKAVAKLHSAARASISMRDAAQRLDTGKAQIADLLEGGLLLRGSDHGVACASISRLIDGLIKQCCAGTAPDELLNMGTAARNAAVPLWRIVQAAREAAIPCWQDDGSGLSQFRIRLRDVILLRTAPRALSIEAAARRIGVHHDCARAMARGGTVSDENGRLTEEGIARFERQYVVGSRIARDLGRSPRALHRQLLDAGVHPVFDLRTHRQAVYRRLDIARLGLLS